VTKRLDRIDEQELQELLEESYRVAGAPGTRA
jgi:hypothetical protein